MLLGTVISVTIAPDGSGDIHLTYQDGRLIVLTPLGFEAGGIEVRG